MKCCRLLLICGLLTFLGFTAGAPAQESEGPEEISLSERDIRRLDVFADQALAKADAAFNRAEYAKARDAYDAFVAKMPKSPVAVYAMYRTARCAHLDGKTAEAIADYQAVADKFPKNAKYAAPALSFLGQCHAAAGAGDEAIKAWEKIATNDEYKKQPEAAAAVAKLVAALKRAGRTDEAAKYVIPVAPDKPKGDGRPATTTTDTPETPEASDAAKAIIREHVRTKPDEAKLRELYKTTHNVKDDPAGTEAYWVWVQQAVVDNGNFSWTEREEGKKYFEFWLAKMKGKFADSDDFQIGLANLHYRADRDREKFAQRLDEQYKKNLKPGDWKRTLKWIKAYRGNWTKTREYAAKLDFETAGIEGVTALMDLLCNEMQESYLAKSTFQKYCEKAPFDKLSNEQIQELITLSLETLKDTSTAKTLAAKLHLDKMSEEKKLQLARDFLKLDVGMAEAVYDQLKDATAGKLELFEHCSKSGDFDKALSLADELSKVEKYAKQFSLKKAEMLQANKRYTEAITAYQALSDDVVYQWRIVECHLALEQIEEAIEQLRKIEKGVEEEAPKAAYRIACIYREAEEKEKCVATLRKLVDDYPGAAEADKAEKELDEMGVAPELPEPPIGLK